MFEKPSLLTRLIVGKSIGFILGVIAFVGAPSFGVEDLKIRVGALLWYVAVGCIRRVCRRFHAASRSECIASMVVHGALDRGMDEFAVGVDRMERD